ncbi:MAG: glycoside hydrolase, partial [Actinomycetota bacterium]|nr:glycoside hydrolase [Actinomycetota bacterium]
MGFRRMSQAAAAVAGLVLVAQGAVAAAARQATVTPESPYTWQGAVASGANTTYDAAAGGPCGQTPLDYCDVTLLNVAVDPSFWATQGGGVQVRLFDYAPNPLSDFDLYVYRSDPSGARGELVASSAGLPGAQESATIAEASGYYLVQVVYFAVTASRYTGEASFVLGSKAPPDIDQPAGFQDRLASNPSSGFRSHSEPHIAQSPVDPNVLVAGSKMYNRDLQDSLAEYEFKIGTYVSFDRGVSWTDLGQLAVCAPEQAPPRSWPANSCYPDENPSLGGTGPEDTDDPDDPADPYDPRGSGDFGEEYITSDVWVQFDDEGNAYAMVLDAPPFESGSGWGMSFHRWETVSPDDLASGQTWGRRIPINAYPTGLEQQLFLDDKNTFDVNNAGPDRDGQTGTMVACWGQNVPALVKQQIVCERSVDGGRTWPEQPRPVSPPTQQLVIGVDVRADTHDPNVFYAAWLHYLPGIVGLDSEMWVAKSIDGGQTWLPPVLAARLRQVPRTFPGQSFRNLSLPIMAVGPGGELYLAYAEYRPAPDPAADEDGMQADVVLVKSTDGGSSWSAPVKVNQDQTNADQFQPYVDVNPQGQVEVAYFDRRLDTRLVSDGAVRHPGNFFIDTWLSRSTDGGQTFTDVRVSHDAWDPTVNPPISRSGEFIGDYQGLVADQCGA